MIRAFGVLAPVYTVTAPMVALFSDCSTAGVPRNVLRPLCNCGVIWFAMISATVTFSCQRSQSILTTSGTPGRLRIRLSNASLVEAFWAPPKVSCTNVDTACPAVALRSAGTPEVVRPWLTRPVT